MHDSAVEGDSEVQDEGWRCKKGERSSGFTDMIYLLRGKSCLGEMCVDCAFGCLWRCPHLQTVHVKTAWTVSKPARFHGGSERAFVTWGGDLGGADG